MRPAHSPSSRFTTSGFTLLELLASVSILVIISSMLFMAYNQASKAWLLAEKRVEVAQQARAALELFTRDLSQAVLQSNSTKRLRIAGQANWISFLAAPVNTRTNQPEVLITYQQVDSTNGLFSLCRTVRTIQEAGYVSGPFPRLSATPSTDVVADNILWMSFSNTVTASKWLSGPAYPGPYNPLAVSLTLTLMDSRSATRYGLDGADKNLIKLSASETYTVKVFLPNR